ncbi:hypothetical protein IMG5_013930 [Ichthyophthirius multifiliis]|uniref:Uncharacterized protein n=1 Tax=Ichthyophthirius multifiliis TaxID=5932 RepID=G0QK75_ICHMU|nr:hypothetical protein IMG5_013930 [Ichthyophthirius multifiliis]EGR34379.1 hypothetical protein IMG5_013930 [Ichthyophthirius multifiliis]|eukprot:XP_004039683.1 hypothetical protein IMG5_013930 [Ichthyophthirius multifiliis]
MNTYKLITVDFKCRDLANVMACSHNQIHIIENFIEVTVHEFLQNLGFGFSGFQMQLWINHRTGQYYGKIYKVAKKIYGSITIVFLKNVLLTARKHYNASDVITDAQLSVHTIALLRDTGYFAEVNENMVGQRKRMLQQTIIQ